MPPRFAYWTIIFGNQPTSFRAATREELLPTFKQIQARHPDALLKYFARGKLWGSDEEARAALLRERFQRSRPPGPSKQPGPDRGPRARKPWRPDGDAPRRPSRPDGGPRKTTTGAGGGRRGSDWRPGGEHKDPRSRFKVPRDVKRRGMARRFGWKKKDEE
jgi:hypothetical protein